MGLSVVILLGVFGKASCSQDLQDAWAAARRKKVLYLEIGNRVKGERQSQGYVCFVGGSFSYQSKLQSVGQGKLNPHLPCALWQMQVGLFEEIPFGG